MVTGNRHATTFPAPSTAAAAAAIEPVLLLALAAAFFASFWRRRLADLAERMSAGSAVAAASAANSEPDGVDGVALLPLTLLDEALSKAATVDATLPCSMADQPSGSTGNALVGSCGGSMRAFLSLAVARAFSRAATSSSISATSASTFASMADMLQGSKANVRGGLIALRTNAAAI